MSNPKASGPLWAVSYNDDGMIADSDGVYTELHDAENTAQWLSDGGGREASAAPCRLLPGHGKWVPVELVTAIDAARAAYALSEDEDECIDTYTTLDAAINAALGGAM